MVKKFMSLGSLKSGACQIPVLFEAVASEFKVRVLVLCTSSSLEPADLVMHVIANEI